MMNRLWLVLGLILLATPLPAQEVAYTGTPMVRLSGQPGDLSEELLSPTEAEEYKLQIVGRDGRYYWASRENVELSRSRSGGVFMIFSSESGFIKLIDPRLNAIRDDLRDLPSERFDYVEVMHTQLGLVVYWGRGQGGLF